MIDQNRVGKFECKPRLQSKILGFGIIALFTGSLGLITLFSYFMPDAMGLDLRPSLPFWWLLWIYGFFSFFLTPNKFIISDTGIEVHTLTWQRSLSWQDFDNVKIYKYQTFLYSSKLPVFTYLIGASLFGFRRSFALNWRDTNYDNALSLIKKNLGGVIEQY